MADIRIRPMRMSDAGRAARIEKICFSSPWPARAFVEEMKLNVCARYLVAVKGRAVVGYAGMWLVVGHCHVTNLAVVPECRRQGIARRLMRALMEVAHEQFEIGSMSLEVRRSNEAAQRLYRSLGFAVRDVMPRYYEDNGEDALVMACDDFTGLLK